MYCNEYEAWNSDVYIIVFKEKIQIVTYSEEVFTCYMLHTF